MIDLSKGWCIGGSEGQPEIWESHAVQSMHKPIAIIPQLSMHPKTEHEKTTAIAHLLSAVPEMYYALEQALVFIEGHEHTHGRPFGAGNSIRFALAKSRGEKPCPHYIDNQGFCHKCGILMDEGLARDSGYWQEGMVEGK